MVAVILPLVPIVHLVALLFILPAAAQDPPPIRQFLQVTPEFCTAGQPRPEHFAHLKAQGVKTVLNPRTPGEHRADEEQAEVERLGMKYINIPVVYSEPTDAQVDEFLKITDDPANRPMLIHCTAAIRVGAFWMIRRIVRDGLSYDDALAEARKVGLVDAPHLEEFVKQYVSRRRPVNGGNGDAARLRLSPRLRRGRSTRN